jgi:chromatin segregation and condensation protein Rec8/ScpA/Scc1 (kleisin family)
VPEKSFTILRYLYRHGETLFEPLILATNSERSELIASFLALLALIRSGRMLIREDESGELYVSIAPRSMQSSGADEATQPS